MFQPSLRIMRFIYDLNFKYDLLLFQIYNEYFKIQIGIFSKVFQQSLLSTNFELTFPWLQVSGLRL